MKHQVKRALLFTASTALGIAMPLTGAAAVYAADVSGTVETFDDVTDYVMASSAMSNEYKCDCDGEIIINTEKNTVRDEDGKRVNYADDEMKEAAKMDDALEAAEYLEKNGYDVIEEDGGTVSISDPYQTMRIIVIDPDGLKDDYGAAKIINNGDEYTLQFTSEKATKKAYESLCQDADNVYLDLVIDLLGGETEETVINTYSLTDTDSYYSWGISYMGLDTAQEAVDTDETVTVAVIDTGVDCSNPYLSGRTLTGYDFGDGDANVTPTDEHGTAVAGIIADGTPDNVSILPVKIFTDDGKATTEMLANGLNYAIAQGADVINMSLGADDPYQTMTFLDTYLKNAHDAGITVVCAAGNEGKESATIYPGNSSMTIDVSAITSGGTISSYSNYGDEIDFTAPGSSIKVIWSSTSTLSGTSAAAPHVAAAAALVKLYDSSLDSDGVKDVLETYSVDLGDTGKDDYYGYGYINLATLFDEEECEHSYTSEVTTEATCTKAGTKTYTCTLCGDTYTEEIAATGHSYTSEVTKEATCTEDGTITYTCSSCGDTYTKTIEAAGSHSYTSEVTKEATCTEDGTITYTCSSCGDTYTETIDATGHTLKYVAAVDATATEDGNVEYWYCTHCDKYYSDEDMTEEIAYEDTIIPATGSTEEESDTIFTWAEDGSSCTATIDGVSGTFECTIIPTSSVAQSCSYNGFIKYTASFEYNGQTYTDTYEVTLLADGVSHTTAYYVEAKAATSTEDGNIEYWYCGGCGQCFDMDGNEISYEDTIIPATGSSGSSTEDDAAVNAYGAQWSDDYSTCILTMPDGTEIEAAITSETVDATCTEDGYIIYTATAVYDGVIYTATQEVTISALGHGDNVIHVEAVAATSTDAGNIEYWCCADCGKYYADESLTEEITLEGTIIPADTDDSSEDTTDVDSNSEDGDSSENSQDSDSSTGTNNGNSDETDTGRDTSGTSSVSTGDESNIILPVVLIIIAAAAVVAILVVHRKNKKGNKE